MKSSQIYLKLQMLFPYLKEGETKTITYIDQNHWFLTEANDWKKLYTQDFTASLRKTLSFLSSNMVFVTSYPVIMLLLI